MELTNKFLPISKEDMKKAGIEQLDFVFISGDAYVDHPSFSTALISRILQNEGFTVGIIPQPDWTDVEEFRRLGKPRLGFLVNSGNIDSMVNHYTAAKKKRRDDQYSPGGEGGHRPDRAVIVYVSKAREAYKDVPVIIGGIEASLRRFSHYDYWENKVRRSILLDSKADLLVYGMAEKTIIEVANLLSYGMSISNLTNVRGVAYGTKDISSLKDYVELPSFEVTATDKMAYAESFELESYEQDAIRGKTLVQKHGDRYVVQTPPNFPLTEEEMDRVYNLPFTRTYHPIYEDKGGIPALNEVKFSLTSHRGCYGGCSFCALTFHQGRTIQNRSQKSVIDEAALLTTLDDFKGYIHDVGGPTANFRHKSCKIQETHGVCKTKQCMWPNPCKNLIVDHSEYLGMLRKIRKLPGVKKVFIRSGIRYDYLIEDKNNEFFEELCKHHISGQLKVAPEHVSDKVLHQMGKPTREVYDKFTKKYFDINKKLDKKQFLVPYLMSSHPGSGLKEAIELALYIKEMGYTPEQVQDFYPTPGSLSTTMYYTGINPFTKEKVYVPKDPKEKNMQRALLQYNLPENYKLVREALEIAGREDLIGYDKRCLIPPTPPKQKRSNSTQRNSRSHGITKSYKTTDIGTNQDESTRGNSNINANKRGQKKNSENRSTNKKVDEKSKASRTVSGTSTSEGFKKSNNRNEKKSRTRR